MRAMPWPAQTATTAQVTGSRGASPAPASPWAAASLTQRSSSTWSQRSVTRMLRGRPASRAASTAAPMSLVWMWQFHVPSPPTTTMESPMPSHTRRKVGMVSSAASSRYMTS
jgi:hypothetical protein